MTNALPADKKLLLSNGMVSSDHATVLKAAKLMYRLEVDAIRSQQVCESMHERVDLLPHGSGFKGPRAGAEGTLQRALLGLSS